MDLIWKAVTLMIISVWIAYCWAWPWRRFGCYISEIGFGTRVARTGSLRIIAETTVFFAWDVIMHDVVKSVTGICPFVSSDSAAKAFSSLIFGQQLLPLLSGDLTTPSAKEGEAGRID